ncbi:Protein odd-skipped-related 2-B [Trichinella pseudospiralis]|uniref:Protein odd-skipped-related 2-B n=1 Tax=Trichinella pseudospiralis TaxID=6337 RepID=A0A0V1EZH8_TRIPS|nr:Protein odd-skipped-related 2-B [Trichinella pseudospiralis]
MKRRYRCDTCHKPFKLSSSLRNHKKLHDKYGGFVCHLCGTDFIWQQSLVCHASFHVRAGDALNIQSFLDDNSSMLTILPSLEENTDQLLQLVSFMLASSAAEQIISAVHVKIALGKAISTCQKFPLTNAISGRTFILIV